MGSGGVGVEVEAVGGDAGGGVAAGLGAFGGVLGEVAGDGQAGDGAGPRQATVRTSSSSPQAMSQPSPSGLSGWGRVRKQMAAAAWRMASSRSAAVMPGGGAMIASGSSRVVPSRRSRAWKWTAPRAWYSAALPCGSADRAAGLPLGPRGCRGGAASWIEVAFDVLLGAPPQFPGGGVPHDVGGVVVAVQTQRLAEAGVAGRVPPVAGQGAAVRAGAGVAAGVAGFGLAVAALSGRRRCGGGRAGSGPGRRTGR